MTQGEITRISGPIIYARGLQSCALYDVVDVGEQHLIGEIIRQNGELACIQVYEDVSGMKTGEAVVSRGAPLSLKLGPGLVGTIYDGIQRPLRRMFEQQGAFLQPGQRVEPLDSKKKWDFKAENNIRPGGDIMPGMILGTVQETGSILHRITVSPVIRGRRLKTFLGSGSYTVDDVIAETEQDEEICLSQLWPVRRPRPFTQKLEVSEPLVTGQRVIDVFFPLSKGGAAAIPGGFGTGKTMTQHAIAKWCDADLIVYIGCGERGNEMTDVLTEFPTLIDPRTGRSLMERTILIANTSNMPVAAREVSLYSGITLAEYYRDMGYHVAVMADSTSRWAEALRELSGRMEELPAEEGYPAYLPTRLAEFYERAGRVTTLAGSEGSVSVIGAVSPAGGDFSEPVTAHTKRFIRCFWALDKDLANARHYPAIGWIDSYSEYADEIKTWWEKMDPGWAKMRLRSLSLLKREQRLQQIVRLIGEDALPDNDRLLLFVCEMIKNGFLQQNAFDTVDAFSVPEKQVKILHLIMDFYDKAQSLIKGDCPLLNITEMNVVNEIVRAALTVPNDSLDALNTIQTHLDGETAALEKEYCDNHLLEADLSSPTEDAI